MKTLKFILSFILLQSFIMVYSQQKEPYSRGVHWGMEKQDILKIETKDQLMKRESFDSDLNLDKVVYCWVNIDLCAEMLRNGLHSTYLSYYFDKDKLVKIHFPINDGLLDTSVCRSYYNDLVKCLSEKYKKPIVDDPQNMHGEWETKNTKVSVFVKTEFLDPAEESNFINYSYTQETYENPSSYRMFLRVTIEKKSINRSGLF
jgi:hypothetical protein